MSEVIIFDRIQLRRGTAADLTSVNEVLRAGEACVELTTGKFKIGDGVTAWNSLPYQGIWTLADIRQALDLLGSTAEGDLIYKGAAGWTRLAKGSDGQVLTLAAGVPAWGAGSGGSGGYLDPSTNLLDPIYDFLGKPPNSTTDEVGASYPWSLHFAAGTNSITSIDGGATSPGVWRLAAGSGSGDRLALTLGEVPNLAVGAGAIVLPFRFRLPTLSNATTTFGVNIGLADDFAAATARIYLNYVYNANAGALRLVTTHAGATTLVNGTGAPLVANTWVSGRIEINAAGTQVDLYEGATLVASATTNIPTAAMLLGASNIKSAGAGICNLDLDYLGPPQLTFTSAR